MDLKELTIYKTSLEELKSNEHFLKDIVDCYQNAWSIFHKQMNISQVPSIEDFKDVDDIISIYYKNECVSMIALGYIDIDKKNYKENHFLSSWSQKQIDVLKKHGGLVQTTTRFSVCPIKSRLHKVDFSELGEVYSWVDLMTYILEINLLEENLDVNALMPNASNHMIKILEKYPSGGISLDHIVNYKGVDCKVYLIPHYKYEIEQKYHHIKYARVLKNIKNSWVLGAPYKEINYAA